jgi:hypothetical protein
VQHGVSFEQRAVIRAQPHVLALQCRQRDQRRADDARAADRAGDPALDDAEERAGDRRDRADGSRALRADLKQRQQAGDDDDADQGEELSFVSIGEDDWLRWATQFPGDGYFVAGRTNPDRRNARTNRPSGRPITV